MATKLFLMCVTAVSAAYSGAAMPTEAEVEKAVPKVERMLASEKVALESGKMTRAEVAAAAMKLAAGADDEAAKLLLMKGAFILHVKDGDLEKAVKTMNALETAIADMPPQIITNIIETALLGLPNKGANGSRLYRLLDAGSVKRKGSYQNRVQKVSGPKRYFVTKEEIWRLLSSAQPRQKIAVPQSDSPEELPVFPNPAEAQRKAKELGLWMFVYNMPGSRNDTFSSSSYFLKSLSKHCVFVHVNGFGSESAECPWERSTCWPCCRILDSDGNLISSVAKWSGMPNCEVSGQKMTEIFNGFMKACEIMPAAFDIVERNPNEIGLARLQEALSSLPESFVNIAYLKWAELLVKVDCSGKRGWRACYSYADKILPLQEEFYRSDDCSFNNSYWRAKRDKEKYHDFLSGIDRVVLERRISASDDIRKRISAIDEQSLSDEARYRLTYLRQEVEKSYERLSDIQRDLLALEKWPEQKENVPALGAKPRVADGDGSEVIDGYTWSYRVHNGEATIVAEKDGKPCCAVSPKPIGHVAIPSTLGGVRVSSIGQEAFRDCKELKMVTIPPSVTNIGDVAFYSCDIKSVNIPASVTSIGTQAFSDNSELMSFSVEESNPSYLSRNGLLCTKDGTTLISGTSGVVEIPPSVTSIEGWAFTGRRRLTSVTIPPSVTNIGRTAFRWCSGLKSITIPPAVTRLDSNAFRACSGLTSVEIPSNVTSIGWCAFCQCGGLTAVTIPASVTRIDGCAFWSCGSLVSVTIPASVMSIGERAFNQCGSLASVTMCGECPTAPKAIFQGCPKLKSIHVPANAKSWTGMKEWQGIPLVFDGELKGANLVKVESMSGKNVVAQKLQGCNFLFNKNFKRSAKVYLCLFSASWCGPCRREMPRIAKTYAEALKDDPDIELIHFSRDQDDEKAMAWAKEHDVKFPVVKPKGGNPLDLHCNGIPHLFVVKADGTLLEEGHPMRVFTDEKLCELKKGNFVVCAKLQSGKTDVNTAVGEQKEIVGGYTWSFKVENGEATIGSARPCYPKCAIAPSPTGTLNIPSVLGGAKVTRIGYAAFYKCSGLTSVTIPPSVTKIDWQAFYKCSGLTSVTIPSSVTTIDWMAFADCGSLTSVMIPASVKNLARGVFRGCSRLTSISVSAENENYITHDSVIFDKGMRTLVCYPGGFPGAYKIPSGVTEIGEEAFSKCRGLTSVVIPDSVTRIGKWAFAWCGSLKVAEVGSGVAAIEEAAFSGCDKLTSIFVSGRNGRFASRDGLLFSKDMATVICCPAGLSGTYKIPPNVMNIGAHAFDGCQGLMEVVIPSSVTKIGNQAFNQCNGLTSVTIPTGVKEIGELAFWQCENLKEVMIPSSVEAIDRGAFECCYAMKSVTISEGVQSIGKIVFFHCQALTSVTIPASVKKIGENAFLWCKELTSVTMLGECPDVGGKIFASCDKLAAIHVPANAKSWAGMREWQGIPLVFD